MLFETEVEAAASSLVVEKDILRFTFRGMQVVLPSELESAVRFILHKTGIFTARDVPGSLSLERKVQLAGAFTEVGALVVEDSRIL
jgi:hypothetical protein